MTNLPTLASVMTQALKPSQKVRRHLPARVVSAIESQENSSEILIKLIQITIFGLWGVLYFMSPKPEVKNLMMGFSPVPWALSAYLVLNIIGLVWALRRGLPDWAVYVNVLIDISMLMVLIWSFHIQYNQPPSFYLKAPTFIYVFIFIALRALRFQARFVLAAGLAAVIGWLILTLYVIFSDPQDTMITRNYVEYLTSNSVLIGAEVDKIISIIFVTLIMALAIVRARALLVGAVSEGVAAKDLARFFDRSVADKITGAEQALKAGEGIRRNAAILFTDIRGFTPLAANMPASDAVCLLSEYQKRLVAIVEKNGGSIDKFMGDGILASFGAVADSKTYAADALRCVDEIVAETDTWYNDDKLARIAGPKVNCAVAAGPVVFGVLGADNRLEYTTIGPAVNLAAKLEKCNKQLPSRALGDAATLALAEKQGYENPGTGEHISRFLDTVGEQLDLVVLHQL